MKPAKTQKIMIVDDSPMDRVLLKHIIEKFQYTGEISCHENPLEAIQLIKKAILKKEFTKIPELIFLDLNMPEMHGFNFLDSFMKFPKEMINKCKIIILTSSDDVCDIQKCASYPNVIDFIVKPIQKIDFTIKNTLIRLKL